MLYNVFERYCTRSYTSSHRAIYIHTSTYTQHLHKNSYTYIYSYLFFQLLKHADQVHVNAEIAQTQELVITAPVGRGIKGPIATNVSIADFIPINYTTKAG